MEMTCKVGDLNKLILESSNEFKAIIGDGVESEDKKNSDKTYSDSKKRAKDYDGGLKDEDFAKGTAVKHTKYEKTDGNKTLLDYNPENASPEMKKKWEILAQGYNSEAEKNNGIEKVGDFSDNENIYKGIKDCGEKMHDNEKNFKRAGLRGNKMPADTFDRESMYESKDGFDMRNFINTFRSNTEQPKSTIQENVQTVRFKKMKFLNESHMISRIPDEFKAEGKQFKMEDSTGNKYLVEWRDNKGVIIGHSNKSGMNESIERMSSIYNYTSKDTETSQQYRLNEGEQSFLDVLNKVRNLK